MMKAKNEAESALAAEALLHENGVNSRSTEITASTVRVCIGEKYGTCTQTVSAEASNG